MTDPDPLAILADWLQPILLCALVVQAVRGLLSRWYWGLGREGPRRWARLVVYASGLVAGGATGLGLALETEAFAVTIGVALGLGATVVGVPLIERRLRAVRARR